MIKRFSLYQTQACHLCELAEAVIAPYIQPLELIVSHVDIADDDALIEQYGTKIPVLLHQESQYELAWPFDESQLRVFLSDCLKSK